MDDKRKSSWDDPEIRARRVAAIKAAMNRPDVQKRLRKTVRSDEYRQRRRVQGTEYWQNPKYVTKVLKARSDVDRIALHDALSTGQKAHYQTAAGKRRRKATGEQSKQRWQNGEYRRKQLAKLEVNREQASAKAKAQWADPEFHKKMLVVRKAQITKAGRKRNSQRVKALWADPEYRAKMDARTYGPDWKINHAAAMEKRKGTPAWNKGLTKETNAALMKLSKRFRGKIPVKSGYLYQYDGKKVMLMRSRWEVAFAEYLDSVGVQWVYEPKSYYVGVGEWLGCTYTPDFLVLTEPDFLAEIKGEFTAKDREKLRRFAVKHPKESVVVFDRRGLEDLGIDLRDWILKKRIPKIAVTTNGVIAA